jgi:CRP-like cAMP-binding protein
MAVAMSRTISPTPELTRMLREAAWATGLTPEQQQRVEQTTYERSFPAACVLCHKGAPSSHWIGVIDGLVKLQSVAADGRSTTFIGVTTGGWFGEGAVLKHEPRPYEVVTLQQSRLAFMPVETFDWLVSNSLFFCRYLIDQLNARLGQFVALVERQRLHDGAACMVAAAIAELFNPRFTAATSAAVKISQEEVGRLSGLSRQMVSRALRHLGQTGALRVRYGQIQVIDMDRLRSQGHLH